MSSKLDVTVAVDIGSGTITVTPKGELTLGNVRGLIPVASRAATVAPGFHLTLDLTHLAAAEPAALNLLRGAQPAETRFLTPGPAPTLPGKSRMVPRSRKSDPRQGAAA
jgi:hypothetical protein